MLFTCFLVLAHVAFYRLQSKVVCVHCAAHLWSQNSVDPKSSSPYLVDFEVARSSQEPESLPVVLAVFDRRASIKQPEVTQGVQLPAASPNAPKPVSIALGAER